MSNSLLTPQVITNELLRRFKNNLGFAASCTHEYDDKFDKIGATINLREPTRLAAVKSATLSVQDVSETSVPLTINTQAHTGFQFTSKDLTLTVDKFADRYLNSAAVSLANTFDLDGLTMAYQATPNLVGTPGTTPASFLVWKQALAKLDKNSCPFDGDRYVVMNSDAETSTVDALKGLFQSSEQIKKQYEKGRMGTTAGADWKLDQNVVTHQVGPLGGAPAVNGAGQSGASLVTNAWTAAAALRLRKGDVFTIAGVYAVNPVSTSTLADLRQFVVTADVSSDASGNATIPISPAIVLSGPTQNVSAGPAAGALLTIATGTSNQLTPQNLTYHKSAFVYAMVKLEIPRGVHFAGRASDDQTGLSLRIVSSYDIVNDLFVTRCDAMYGWAARRPTWACRVAG